MSNPALPPPRRQWNHPTINIFRVNICFLSFFNCGLINGSFGPLIPPWETYYNLNYTTVSFTFLTLIPGYFISAFITDYLVSAGGRRLIAILAAALRLIPSVVVATHPPFAVVMAVMLLSGLGTAMVDSTWNVYIGTMEHAHQLLGLLHGIFGIGCTVGQVFASVVLAREGKPWWYYYYLQLGAHALELVLATVAFWGDGPVRSVSPPVSESRRSSSLPQYDTDEKTLEDVKTTVHSCEPRREGPLSTQTSVSIPQQVCSNGVEEKGDHGSDSQKPIKQKIKRALHLLKRCALEQPTARLTWLVTLYFGLEWGNEIALAGWNVTFMERIRHASAFSSTMSNMGFWIAFSVGRIVMGFVTAVLGEVSAVAAYLVIVIVSQLIYWLVDNFYVSAVAIALDGFFLGPVFPAAVFVMGKVLPEELHVVAMSFSMALGLALGEILPFVAGVIAQKRGVQNVMPLVLAMVVATLATWLAITRSNWRIWRRSETQACDDEGHVHSEVQSRSDSNNEKVDI